MKSLGEIVTLFLKLGIIGFGGPAAHIAMMEEEVVTRRRWMSREHFLDLVGATNLIPGPNSTEMAIHVGFHRGGVPGLLAAGICFILPAVLTTGLLAFFYVAYGALPQVQPFLIGIKPAVIALIISAVLKLGKKAVKSWQLAMLGAGVTVLVLAGLNEVLAILIGGVFGLVWLSFYRRPSPGDGSSAAGAGVAGTLSSVMKSSSGAMVPAAAAAAGGVSLTHLGLVFLKIGCVLFGSGYVLIAFMEGELVQNLGWLTEQQLLDAIAIGQFTPGPVLSTATFVGYQIAGIGGAVVATIAIFLPSFFFVAILNPLIPKMRKSRLMSAFLDAVNVSAVALMVAVCIQLAESVLTDWRTILIAVAAAAVVVFWPRVSAVWLVIGGALVGYLLYLW